MPRGIYERTAEIKAKISSHSDRYREKGPEYAAVHQQMRSSKTGVCIPCGAERRTEMALIKGRGVLVSEHGGKVYSTDPADYTEMCVPCHRKYDDIKPKREVCNATP